MMNIPQRRSPRLQGYDYTHAGAYFVTICTHQRLPLFGTIENGEMHLSPEGMTASQQLASLPTYWHGVDVDLYVVMPNHVHAIIVLVGTAFLPSESPSPLVETAFLPSDADKSDTENGDESGAENINLTDAKNRVPTLGRVVGNYKSGVTRIIRRLSGDDTLIVWQGRYHDHIIRDERGLAMIRGYIETNPARWSEDTFFTQPHV